MERLSKKIGSLLEQVHRIELYSKPNTQAAQIQYVNSIILGLAQYYQPFICSHAYHAIDRRVNNAALAVWKKLFPKQYKQFGKQTVLHDVSITFEDHTIYGLIGPNGCGKTTLMRCICGFTKPTDGTVTVDGKVIGKDCDFAPSTGIIIETPGFLPHNSAWRNLAILAGISGKADKARIDEVIRLVGLDPNDKKPVSKYSLGMRQRLGIAQAIMENPTTLILDEPFNGLDKDGVRDIHGLLQQQKAQGKTIILASHSAADIAQACDVVYEMTGGRLERVG